MSTNANAAQNTAADKLCNPIATLSVDYTADYRAHQAIGVFGVFIEDFLLFSGKSSVEKMSSGVAFHFRDNIAKRFLNGQTELGAAKCGRWMSRTVCRRPARWAPFFST